MLTRLCKGIFSINKYQRWPAILSMFGIWPHSVFELDAHDPSCGGPARSPLHKGPPWQRLDLVLRGNVLEGGSAGRRRSLTPFKAATATFLQSGCWFPARPLTDFPAWQLSARGTPTSTKYNHQRLKSSALCRQRIKNRLGRRIDGEVWVSDRFENNCEVNWNLQNLVFAISLFVPSRLQKWSSTSFNDRRCTKSLIG